MLVPSKKAFALSSRSSEVALPTVSVPPWLLNAARFVSVPTVLLFVALPTRITPVARLFTVPTETVGVPILTGYAWVAYPRISMVPALLSTEVLFEKLK